MSAPNPKITLFQIKTAENTTNDIEKFTVDFVDTVKDLIFANPENWSNTVHGNLYQNVTQTDDFENDFVSVGIENENGEDGGYVHIYGYKESDTIRLKEANKLIEKHAEDIPQEMLVKYKVKCESCGIEANFQFGDLVQYIKGDYTRNVNENWADCQCPSINVKIVSAKLEGVEIV